MQLLRRAAVVTVALAGVGLVSPSAASAEEDVIYNGQTLNGPYAENTITRTACGTGVS